MQNQSFAAWRELLASVATSFGHALWIRSMGFVSNAWPTENLTR